MATAPAKRGRAVGTKKKKAASPPIKKKRKRAKNKQGKKPAIQKAFLQTVLEESPGITSDQFAAKFNLPIEEVARHRAFILQYTLDYKIKEAAIRMGYPESIAFDVGFLMLNYAFAQLFLSEIQKAKTIETVITQGQLASKLVEELNRPDTVMGGCAMTNSATRLTAGKLLMRLMGLLNPKPKEEVQRIRRVMFVGERALQMIGAEVNGWGEFAQDSQRRLKTANAIDV